MRYEGKIYRPPSEADALIVQATIGCSWNHCTYCDMYRTKDFRVRPAAEVIAEIRALPAHIGARVQKVFVADGDALCMPMSAWVPVLEAFSVAFPRLRRVSTYATASNVLEKSVDELQALRSLGLTRLYLGPESGDDATLHRIAKGQTFAQHVEAARRAHDAKFELSVIFLLGAGGVERSDEHALGSARLATEMDPAYLAALTLTVVEETPIARLRAAGKFVLPDPLGLLRELRTFVEKARPRDATFRTNHASNYLSLGGQLPRDSKRIVAAIDAAIGGAIALRPEPFRGL